MGFEVKKINKETVGEIQQVLGKDLVYLVAVDVDGNQTILTGPAVTETNPNFSRATPVKNEGITGFDSAGYLSYQGSCVYCYTSGGQRICYTYPC